MMAVLVVRVELVEWVDKVDSRVEVAASQIPILLLNTITKPLQEAQVSISLKDSNQ